MGTDVRSWMFRRFLRFRLGMGWGRRELCGGLSVTVSAVSGWGEWTRFGVKRIVRDALTWFMEATRLWKDVTFDNNIGYWLNEKLRLRRSLLCFYGLFSCLRCFLFAFAFIKRVWRAVCDDLFYRTETNGALTPSLLFSIISNLQRLVVNGCAVPCRLFWYIWLSNDVGDERWMDERFVFWKALNNTALKRRDV